MMATCAMLEKSKDQHYNAVALLMTGPIGLVGWIEGLTCDSFLVHVGGHFWYDMTIPMSMTAYIVYLKYAQSSSSKVKAE